MKHSILVDESQDHIMIKYRIFVQYRLWKLGKVMYTFLIQFFFFFCI